MSVLCPICYESNIQDLIYHQNNYKCLHCGHLFKDGAFDFNWYKKVDYWYKDSAETLRLYQKMFYSIFEDYILKTDNALEIGAADGDFLFHLSKKVNSIYYNELEDLFRSGYSCKEKFIGDLKTIDFKNQKFQNVFLNDVIEHFDDIHYYMKILEDITEEGSRLFLITNNGDFLNAHNELIYHHEHYNIFTHRSFSIFLDEFKFKEVLYFNSPQGLSFIVLERL